VDETAQFYVSHMLPENIALQRSSDGPQGALDTCVKRGERHFPSVPDSLTQHHHPRVYDFFSRFSPTTRWPMCLVLVPHTCAYFSCLATDQGLTLVNFSAQLKRFLRARG
jgi:hypothetical protein